MAAVTYLEAIRQGIWEEMERDPQLSASARTLVSMVARSRSPRDSLTASAQNVSVDTPISQMAIVNASLERR